MNPKEKGRIMLQCIFAELFLDFLLYLYSIIYLYSTTSSFKNHAKEVFGKHCGQWKKNAVNPQCFENDSSSRFFELKLMTDQGLRNLHLSESCQNPKFATETKETFTSRDRKMLLTHNVLRMILPQGSLNSSL